MLLKSDCGNLTDPLDGSVNFTCTTYESQAKYSCNTGYLLVGNKTRVCEETATWSNIGPRFQKKGDEIHFD